LLLTANGFIPGGSVLQCKTGQYNAIKYNIITHITQNVIQHSRQPSISKITKTKKKRFLRGKRPAADCLRHGTAFEGSEAEE